MQVEGTQKTKTEICKLYFDVHPNGRKCRVCPQFICKSRTTQNLFSHIERKHRNYVAEVNEGTVGKASAGQVKVDVVSEDDYYAWMKRTVARNMSGAANQPPCYRTFRKKCIAVTEIMKRDISAAVKDIKMGLMFDSWAEAGRHFLAVFAQFPSEKDWSKVELVLLGIRPLLDPTYHNAGNHEEAILDILSEYNIDVNEQVVFGTADNAVNPCVLHNMGIPLIGCFKHKLNLAVQDLLAPQEIVVQKIKDTMTLLSSTSGIRTKLTLYTSLRPIVYCTYNWNSMFKMLKRYKQLQHILWNHHIDLGIPQDWILTPDQNSQLITLLHQFKAIRSLSLQLDSGDCSMEDARDGFDGLREDYPELNDKLKTDSHLVTDPNFDAIVKIQCYQSNPATTPPALSEQEILAVQKFRAAVAEPAIIPPNEAPWERVKRQRLAAAVTSVTLHPDLRWIQCTSVPVERLFLEARRLFVQDCESISVGTLQYLLLLKCNSKYWNLETVRRASEVTTIPPFYEDDEGEAEEEEEDEVVDA